MTYDAVIVGTGPAGLSAALAFGRARRTTLLIDGGPGRNAPRTTGAVDMARRPALPLSGAQVILAAAEGTLAAIVIDQELLFTQPQPTDHP